MNSDKEYPYKDLTFVVIGSLYEVYNRIGFGYREKVYHQALAEELKLRGLGFKRESFSRVSYKGKIVGSHFNDFLIEEKVILEIKIGNAFYENQLR